MDAIKETQTRNSRNEKCGEANRSYRCKHHQQNIREERENLGY